MSDRIDVTSKKRLQFVECRGNFRVISASFVSKTPRIIPISIEGFNHAQINKLPLCISLYGSVYQLGGCSRLNTGEHFVHGSHNVAWKTILIRWIKVNQKPAICEISPRKDNDVLQQLYKGSHAY